jgi:hypothetical protein
MKGLAIPNIEPAHCSGKWWPLVGWDEKAGAGFMSILVSSAKALTQRTQRKAWRTPEKACMSMVPNSRTVFSSEHFSVSSVLRF